MCVLVTFVLGVSLVREFVGRMTPVAFMIGMLFSGGLFFAFARALWIGRARLEIHGDHAFFDYRPKGATHRCFTVEFEELTSVAMTGSRLLFRVKNGPTIEFHGTRLHVEDAFDALVANLDENFPDCMVLRRRAR